MQSTDTPETTEVQMSTLTHSRRELAHRVNDGIEVSLFWDRVGDLLVLEVYDGRLDEYFELEVPRDRAMDAFRHPYAYRVAAECDSLTDLFAA